MLKDKDIICISSIDWDFIWQGHQEIMSRLATNGNRVLYIENTGVRSPRLKDFNRITKRIQNWKKGLGGFREVKSNLFVLSPLVIPLPYSKIAQSINTWLMVRLIKKWMESASFHDPIIWTFLPTQLTINLIKQIKNQCVIYYCIDSFVDSSEGARNIVSSEEYLFGLADIVFVTSHKLFDKAKVFSQNVHFFPFAVDLEGFRNKTVSLCELPEELKNIEKPIIGYIGGIHKWINFDLIEEVAEDKPDWQIVMVGPVQVDVKQLKKKKNIIFTGAKKHEELPSFIRNFDVCLIPYLLVDYTQNVYPTKLTEYLSFGKPIVATPIVELEWFNNENPNIIEIANAKDTFISSIEKSLLENNNDLQKERIKVAEENSWSRHLEKMSLLIDEKIIEKDKQKSSWQDQFKSFYYQKKWTLTKYIVCLYLLWIFFFHTSLMWWLATPLVIQDLPEKTDVIIVFGGGVGESGLAGEGYVERSKRAIDLYIDGNAANVVFMSGYVHIMKEAEMMRALGVEYGIPENKILIDTASPNTYLSVLRAVDILRKKGWENVILVSSPYHMLRVQLCFENIAPEIKVQYVPVEYSGFYDWPKKLKLISWNKQITIKQLKGIIHEVLGIIYYRYKGYI